MTLGWLAISGKGASVTLDTKGVLVEVGTGVEELAVVVEAESWGATGDEEGVALVLAAATERRPELS